MCPVWKSAHFLIFDDFFKNSSPGQTTVLTRRASKFCVEPRSPFSEVFDHDPKNIGKTPNIVSWPECPLELPSTTHDWVSHDSRLQFQVPRLTTTTSQGALMNILVCVCVATGFVEDNLKGETCLQ